MKKQAVCVLALCLVLILGGCGDMILVPDMTDEQMELTSQYAATILLKHSKEYDDGIMSVEEMEKLMKRTIIPTAVPTPEPEKNDKDGNVQDDFIGDGGESGIVTDNRTFSDFFGFEGVDFAVTGYEIKDSYPDGEGEFFFAMDATTGTKLLILHVDVKNNNPVDTYVDVLSMKVKCRIFLNDGPQINALTTLLSDDLKTLQDTIPAGTTINDVVIIEIPEADAMNIDNSKIELMVRTNEDSLRRQIN